MAAKAIVFLVWFDPETGRWNITRNDVQTGAFARDKETAIGQAFSSASREAREPGVQAEVWSIANGERKKEWP